MNLEDKKIAVIGLGYVGLPLAVEFGKRRKVVGFDIKPARIDELRAGRDSTLEIETHELTAAQHLSFTSREAGCSSARFSLLRCPLRLIVPNDLTSTPL